MAEVYFSLFSNVWSLPATGKKPTYVYNSLNSNTWTIIGYKDSAKVYFSNPIGKSCVGGAANMAQYVSPYVNKSCVAMNYYGILEFGIGYKDIWCWGVNKYNTPSAPESVKVLATIVFENG